MPLDKMLLEVDCYAGYEPRGRFIGESQPGTIGGEVRRSVTMYRSFKAKVVTMHFARALARGWDGRRLSHAALAFASRPPGVPT